MSIHGTRASKMKCAICDIRTSLEDARRKWRLCTICGSYLCPRCYTRYRESEQVTCPGAIVRGIAVHTPHFTRFLSPRRTNEKEDSQPSRIIFLNNISQRSPPFSKKKVAIKDDPSSINPESDTVAGEKSED